MRRTLIILLAVGASVGTASAAEGGTASLDGHDVRVIRTLNKKELRGTAQLKPIARRAEAAARATLRTCGVSKDQGSAADELAVTLGASNATATSQKLLSQFADWFRAQGFHNPVLRRWLVIERQAVRLAAVAVANVRPVVGKKAVCGLWNWLVAQKATLGTGLNGEMLSAKLGDNMKAYRKLGGVVKKQNAMASAVSRLFQEAGLSRKRAEYLATGS